MDARRSLRSAHRWLSLAKHRRSVFDAEPRSRRGPFRRCTAIACRSARTSRSLAATTRSSRCTRSRLIATSSTDSPAATRSRRSASASRTISIVRIQCDPDIRGNTRLAAFDGEIDLDAERAQIVRMRGGCCRRWLGRDANERSAQRFGVVAAAYVEFVNAEINGTYWLPAFQRTEFQASFPIFGQTRPVFRLVSTIGAIAVTDTGGRRRRSRLRSTPRVVVTWAPSDSVNAFREWRRELGTQSSSVHSDDFDDIAPDAWRTDWSSANRPVSVDDESNSAIQPRRRSVHGRRAVDRLSHRRSRAERGRVRRMGVGGANGARRRIRLVPSRRTRSTAFEQSARSRRRTTLHRRSPTIPGSPPSSARSTTSTMSTAAARRFR